MTAPAPQIPYDRQKLSLAHQVLANNLGFLVAQVIWDGRTQLALTIIEESLPLAQRAFPVIEAVIDAAHAVVRAAPLRAQKAVHNNWAAAMMQAHAAMADFFYWRASLAYGALHPQPEIADVA